MKPSDADKHVKILRQFVSVFCRKKHGQRADGLCESCRDLLRYARQRLDKCPFDPKPKCKDCLVHCYAQAYRARIKEVMRFSGMHFVKRGRLDWLVRYFLSRK